jgi:hypothetical protein
MRWAAVPNTRIQSMQRAEIIDTRGERLGWMQFSAPGGASDNDKNGRGERQAMRAPQAACIIGPDSGHYAPRGGASPATKPEGGERIARRCLDGDAEALAMFEPEDADALAAKLWANAQIRDEFGDDREALVAHLRAEIRLAVS